MRRPNGPRVAHGQQPAGDHDAVGRLDAVEGVSPAVRRPSASPPPPGPPGRRRAPARTPASDAGRRAPRGRTRARPAVGGRHTGQAYAGRAGSEGRLPRPCRPPHLPPPRASRVRPPRPRGTSSGWGGSSGRRSAGGSSASRTSSSTCSSPCSRATTCCWRACPAWPRRCSSRPWRSCSTCRFSRIQFTPDLMPSDITGTEYLIQDAGHGRARVPLRAGADLRQRRPRRRDQPHAAEDAGRAPGGDAGAAGHEPRAPPACSSRRSSCSRPRTRSSRRAPTRCPRPSSTASCSRCFSSTRAWEQEERIARMTVRIDDAPLTPVASRAELLAVQEAMAAAPVPPSIVHYAVQLAQASRPSGEGAPADVREYVEWGAGPRAAQALVVGGRARAMLRGRAVPDHEDLAAVAHSVLRHRLILSYAAEADGVGTEQVTDLVLGQRAAPRSRHGRRHALVAPAGGLLPGSGAPVRLSRACAQGSREGDDADAMLGGFPETCHACPVRAPHPARDPGRGRPCPPRPRTPRRRSPTPTSSSRSTRSSTSSRRSSPRTTWTTGSRSCAGSACGGTRRSSGSSSPSG